MKKHLFLLCLLLIAVISAGCSSQGSTNTSAEPADTSALVETLTNAQVQDEENTSPPFNEQQEAILHPETLEDVAAYAVTVGSDFFEDMWGCLHTLKEPAVPAYCMDNASINLYMGWIRYRIAELSLDANKDAILNDLPAAGYTVNKVKRSNDNADEYEVDFNVAITMDRNDGVNGIYMTGIMGLSMTDDGPIITFVEMDEAGIYNEQQRFQQKYSEMAEKTIENVNSMIDSAIDYLYENN